MAGRIKDDHEGVEPAANSTAALNLLRLSQTTDDAGLEKKAARVLAAFSGRLREYPGSMPQMLVAADFKLSKPLQIVLAGDPAAEDTKALLREAHAAYLPNHVILSADGDEGQAFLGGHAEFIKGMKPINGKATAYVCQDYTCQQPTNEVRGFRRQIQKEAAHPVGD